MPVDWQALNLVDYPLIVKEPMDLGTVRKKVSLGQYEHVEDALEDIQLVWGNAKTYNPREHVCIANTGDPQVGRQAGEADKEDHQELLAVC